MDIQIEELTGAEVAKIYSQNDTSKSKLGEKYENLGDRVYHKIKEEIILRKHKPGDRIIDREIAENLGVSRSLVRQALNILEKEDLVVSRPRTGYYVKKITKKDIKDIYELRRVLEEYAAEKSVSLIGKEKIDELEKLFEEAREDLNKNQVEKLVKADAELHRVLIANCGNSKIEDIIYKFNSLVLFYRVMDLTRENRAKNSFKNHYEIFKAVKNNKPSLVSKLIGEHINFSKNMILKNYKEYTFGEI